MTKQTHRSNDLSSSRKFDADVAAIVDAVLDDPARADDAKALLTQKLGAPEMVRVAVAKTAPKAIRAQEEADDDMWDNVPV
ncbi:MAG: hypothetical protein KJO30_11200 [Boseongicola sp.]|nr:hypothetical protein [Boseongicola sp.]NNJ68210.1 hypothetical protein [Boseongicola sp.]